MKLIMEMNEDNQYWSKVIIESHSVSMADVIKDVKAMLLAQTFHPALVNEAFGEEDEEV